MNYARIVERISLITLLFFGVLCVQYTYDTKKPSAAFAPLVVFPVPVLRAADLHLDTAAASLIWLNSIQEIGTVAGSYEGLVNDIQTINTLDPKFAYPYAFAELVLPGLDPSKVADAIAIGKKGVANTSDWRIPFYLASTYVINLDDRENALKYFDIAARTPGIPDGLHATALNFGTQSDKRAQTKQIWTAIYQSTNDEILKEQAASNLAHIGIIESLERAIRLYWQEKGVYPQGVADLVSAGLLPGVPQDPFGLVYTIDSDGKLKSHL